MIISRTPYRISFFGGGTDFPDWYLNHGGDVLSTSIDKYCYISIRNLPPFFEHRLRLVYSTIESVQNFEELRHPSARETLRFLEMHDGLEIHHDGDLPARSGVGSSSSFTVGLLNALYGMKGQMVSKERLAQESIYIEQNLIKETVGSQDQIAAAFGGLNHVHFATDGSFYVQPLVIPDIRIKELSSSLMLFFTGIKRTSSDVAESMVAKIGESSQKLRIMQQQVMEGIEILSGKGRIEDFGELLHAAWLLKRGLGSKVTNGAVDNLYQRARNAGAVGGKLTGAGGGGFMLLFVPPERQDQVRKALADLLHIPFNFERRGSQIIFYDSSQIKYPELDKERRNSVPVVFRELSSIHDAI